MLRLVLLLVLAGATPLAAAQASDPAGLLRQRAFPVGLDPTGPLDDLTPFSAAVGDAQVVGLGEGTHGTREFHLLRHRLIRFMVERMGFTVLALEVPMAEARAVDAYVQGEGGDAREVKTALTSWTAQTEEVLAAVEWVRAWNEDPAHPRKVRIAGIDLQLSTGAARNVDGYLERVAPGARDELRPVLAAFSRSPFWTDEFAQLPGDERRELARRASDLLTLFDARKAEWSRRSSDAEWRQTRQDARLLVQFTLVGEALAAHQDARDDAMAENVRWLIAMGGPGTRAIVWAHNGHIDAADGRTMGHALRRSLGSAYRPVGLFFGNGRFTARDEAGVTTEFVARPPKPGSLEAFLGSVEDPAYGLDLRALDRTSAPATALARWLEAPHPARCIGAGYAFGEEVDLPTRARASFDALFFVREAAATHLLPSGVRGRWQ